MTSLFGAAMASLVERVVFQICSSLKVTVFFSQSMWGLCFIDHGIPRTT